MLDHDFLHTLGLTIVEVPGLRNEVALVPDQQVLLVRAGLDGATLERVRRWALRHAEVLLAQTR